MNEEIMREISLDNSGIMIYGKNINNLSGSFSYTINDLMDLSGSYGIYLEKSGTNLASPVYRGTDYWIIYKITNSNATKAENIILKDTLPTDFNIIEADSGYSIGTAATPESVTTGNLTISGQDISTPVGTSITRSGIEVPQGTLELDNNQVLTVFIKVTIATA